MRHLPHFIVISAILLNGCDRVENPKNPLPSASDCEGVGNGPGFRRVLLEDFTGFRCPNCPAAADVAKQLRSVYCEDLIIVGVHCTSTFAAPIASPPDPFSTDFRTLAGETYVGTFGFMSLPGGLISRREYGGQQVQGAGSWGEAVADILGDPAQFEVLFSQLDYNSGAQVLDLEVKVAVLQSVTGDHDLIIYLLEDHVTEAQEDNRVPGGIVDPYDHRHVLRDNINGTWGESVITGSANAGDTLTLGYSYSLASNVLVPSNCSLVAYVYRVDNDEVMQVSEQKLIP